MSPDKQKRVGSAIVFLIGVFACLIPLRDRKILWPPDALWQSLENPQRLEIAGGIALIVISIVISIAQNRARERSSSQ
jgi:hypothetical protein